MFKRHFIVWLIATLVFIIITTVWGKSVVIDQVIKEQSMVETSMGKYTASEIQRRSNHAYHFCCNWLADITRTMFLPPERDEHGVWDRVNNAHQTFWTSIYQVIYRIFIISEWFLVYWVMFIAAFVQGLTRRRISVANTEWSSPIRYHLGLHYSLACFGVMLNMLVFPWALHPYTFALLLTVACVVTYLIAANIQQKV